MPAHYTVNATLNSQTIIIIYQKRTDTRNVDWLCIEPISRPRFTGEYAERADRFSAENFISKKCIRKHYPSYRLASVDCSKTSCTFLGCSKSFHNAPFARHANMFPIHGTTLSPPMPPITNGRECYSKAKPTCLPPARQPHIRPHSSHRTFSN